MTREEYKNRLIELRANAEKSARDYNDARMSSDIKGCDAAEEAMDKFIKEYKDIAELLTFDACLKAENPMVAAVTMLEYKVIAKRDKKIGETKETSREICEKNVRIDLGRLHERAKASGLNGIGADPMWIYTVENLNKCMTMRRARDIGCPIEEIKAIDDSYAMSSIAKEINLGKDPCSNTQLLKTLQKIVTAMLGDGYKATSHDVHWIQDLYAKESKEKLHQKVRDHKKFRELIAQVCHRIVTDSNYHVDSKKEK